LRADMRRQGPKISDSSFVAETRSPMRWEWKYQTEGTSSCSIRDLRVHVTAQILLPRWTPPVDTEPGIYAEWNRFVTALETHEAGHKDISAKAASEIAQRVSPLSGSCSFIGQRASDIARSIADRVQDQQHQYDAQTRHGMTQGTMLGLPRGAIGSAILAGVPITLPHGGGQLLARPGTLYGMLLIPVDSAWRAVPAALAATGLSVTTSDSATHVAVFSGVVQEKIGDIPLSSYFDCGTAVESISLTVALAMRPDSSGRSITTIMTDATTRVKGATSVCRSTAMLERRIQMMRHQHLGR
jgi:predicted secreted Zn-dependent protease